MKKISPIRFTYDEDLEVKSCVDVDRAKRLPKTSATIMFKLWHSLDEELTKEEVVTFVWGRHDNYVRRAFDVHLHTVRKFLEGTKYHVDTSKHGIVCLRKK